MGWGCDDGSVVVAVEMLCVSECDIDSEFLVWEWMTVVWWWCYDVALLW